MAVQSGDVQVAYDMPMSMASTYVADDSVQVIAHTFGQNTRIWYNMGPNAGPTADIRVRQAIDKALNFDAIAMVGTAGFGEEVHGTFPAESRYYNEIFTKEERAVDIEGAKALLEEAGYGDGLDLSIVGMQDQNPVFTVMQENLKQEMMISNTYPEMHAAITGADIKGYRTMERGFLDATGFYK